MFLVIAGGAYYYLNQNWDRLTGIPPAEPIGGEQVQIFTRSFTTGFEGYFIRVTELFSYYPSIFEPADVPENQSAVRIADKQNGHTHTITFFDNSAAGFLSAREFWKQQYANTCANCREIAADVKTLPTRDIIAYTNQTREVIIFAYDPGFVVLDLQKPTDNIKKLIATLTIKTEKTSPPDMSGAISPIPSPGTSEKKCIVSGCGPQICAENSFSSICDIRPEYSCFESNITRCEIQSDGQCGWTQTPELKACLAKQQTPSPTPAQKPNPAPATPLPVSVTPKAQSFAVEADDSGFYPQNTIAVPRHTPVAITFTVKTDNVYYGGLTFRSTAFSEVTAKPGESVSVRFSADEDTTISSFWPLSGVHKADLRVVAQ